MRALLHNKTGGMRLAVANREWHMLELLDLSDNGIEEVGGIVVAALICLGPNLIQCNLGACGVAAAVCVRVRVIHAFAIQIGIPSGAAAQRLWVRR